MCLFHGAAKWVERVLLEFSIEIPYRGTVGDCEEKLVNRNLLGLALFKLGDLQRSAAPGVNLLGDALRDYLDPRGRQ